MRLRVLAIRRARLYSPGHQEHDWLVLRESAEQVAAAGHALRFTTEEEISDDVPQADLVLNMCQGPLANESLLAAEARGVRLVNRPSAALDCLRYRLLPRLLAAGLPIPESEMIDTAGGLPAGWRDRGQVWLKRADVHSTGAGDVKSVEASEAESALRDFRERGQPRAVLQEHLEGAVVKFYCVAGHLLNWRITSGDPAARFDHALLERRARHCGEALGLEVYGGECVVTADGSLPVIDVNDWPSFAPCRSTAARAIAAHVLAQVGARA